MIFWRIFFGAALLIAFWPAWRWWQKRDEHPVNRVIMTVLTYIWGVAASGLVLFALTVIVLLARYAATGQGVELP